MFKVLEYVKASDIWETSKDYEDLGKREGLLRGYNVEVTNGTKTDWLSCAWVDGTVEEHFNDEFHQWCREEDGLEYTGRICFRGYGFEEYDFEERDYIIIMEDSEEGQRLAKRITETSSEEDLEDCEYEEPENIDNELGFNPYMGCYDYDC